jgi:hypothetical protein
MRFAAKERYVGSVFLLITSVGGASTGRSPSSCCGSSHPLFSPGTAGLAAALGLACLAVLNRQRLSFPTSLLPRLAIAAALNVFAWMKFSTKRFRGFGPFAAELHDQAKVIRWSVWNGKHSVGEP